MAGSVVALINQCRPFPEIKRSMEMALMKQLQFLPRSKQKETEQIYNFRSYKFTAKELKNKK